MNGRNNSPGLPDVISQLRLPLILLVTYAHSYGAVSHGYDLLASPFDACEVLKLLVSQTLAKVAVPVFFVVSGWLYFCNVETWSRGVYLDKTRRRIRSLLLPYVVANLLMAVKLHLITLSFSPFAVGLPPLSVFWNYIQEAGSQTDCFGREYWMSAPANMPLWFLRDLMCVSLLAPLIYVLCRRVGVVFLALLTVAYLSGVFPFIPGLSAYSAFFFSLGAFMAIRRVNVLSAVSRVEWGSYALFILLAAAMMANYRTPVFTSLMLCFRLVSVAVVFNVARRLLAVTSWRLPATSGKAAYFIYLVHYVFFLSWIDESFFRLFGTSVAALSVHYLLCPLLKAALLLLAYVLYRLVASRLCVAKSEKSTCG